MRPYLETLRESGRKLFLATNSLWDYTHVIMNYLLGDKVGSQRDEEWLEHFDVVICGEFSFPPWLQVECAVGCGKPAYFTQTKPLFEVQTSTGLLHNTNGGSAITPIGEADLPTPGFDSSAPIGLNAAAKGVKARVFQGGNHWDLHKMLEVKSGPEVMYISDHIYSDLNMSKKWVGWRTMLVVPELQTELVLQRKFSHIQHELRALRQRREALEDQLERINRLPAADRAPLLPATSTSQQPPQQSNQEDLQQQQRDVRESHSKLLEEHHQRFHKVWGQLMKTGYQNSRFAHQVERFACLYTSHVSNLSFYSPNKSYRGRMDCMAHEETAVIGPTRQGSY